MVIKAKTHLPQGTYRNVSAEPVDSHRVEVFEVMLYIEVVQCYVAQWVQDFKLK